MSTLKEVSATGDVATGADGYRLHSVVLSPAAAVSSVAIKDTSGGDTILTLKTPASVSSVVWTANDPKGVFIGTTIHATITGAGALVNVEYS